ncbi:MAG TPA: alpha-mannosidase [Thermomicrobiales bacterium]|nr:alpha-mannosidase [Thermomicrobiales bacterium]
MDELTRQKFLARIGTIEGTIYRDRRALPPLRVAPEGAREPGFDGDASGWAELPVGGTWGGYGRTVWLRGDIEIPSSWAGATVVLLARLGDYFLLPGDILIGGPEALLYLDGAPYAGIDRHHEAILLTPEARGGARHALAIEAYSGRAAGQHLLRQYELATRDAVADALAADLRAAYEALALAAPGGLDAAILGRALDAALVRVDFGRPGSDAYYASLAAARDDFRAALAGYRHGERMRLVATGHAHIDVAWLWPLAQTRRKAARTFATALRLMEQYPEFHFTQSQPVLYQFVKEDEPALYAQIKRRVAEGRWEPTGAMWLEPDCNLPSGESLVRQFVHGLRFFATEFGARPTLAWLPDTFGYTAALPQIMRGAGIGHFMTSKLSWNQFDRFPYDTFRWRGLDGSEVLAHFITTPTDGPIFTYNGRMSAYEVAGAARVYREKALNHDLLYLFGYGDGGGGPTREMLEAGRRLGDLPGMPRLEQGPAEAAFDTIERQVFDPANTGRLPIWDGELYFEYHRGTYTSQGRTKYAHRRAEVLLHEAELWAATAHARAERLPGGALDDAWRLLLLQEFHDILPGSAIREVYEDAGRDLADVAARARAARDADLDRLVAAADRPGPALVAFNGLPWPRRDPLECALPADAPATFAAGDEALTVQELDAPGGERRALVAPPAAGVPPLGYDTWGAGGGRAPAPAAAGGLAVSETVLENACYRIELDSAGLIASLRDKRVDGADGGREVIAPGERGNRLIAFEDRPIDFDAWDIDIFYQEKPEPLDALESLRVIERGPLRAGVELVRRYRDSTVTQRLLLYRDVPRIDVATEIDWHENQVLLKVAFPVTVRARRATYEIQFGAIERPTHWNTSWDRARFEVWGHRWADLSEGDYGVALLNDGKYGHDIRGHVMRLTLLKSGIHPDPTADQGRHRFTYSLLPHPGDWRAGDVLAHAAALNVPLVARHAPAAGAGGRAAPRLSLVACDRPGLVVDTVKPADDGRGVIVRLYEAYGTRGPATLRFAHPVAAAETCDLLETRLGDADLASPREVRLAVRPHELTTLRVVFAGE